MVNKLPIIEQEFITSSGKKLDGVEKVVACPMWICNVNVKKNCGKCLNKVKIDNKEKSVYCKYKNK
jgi:hypothetical protein